MIELIRAAGLVATAGFAVFLVLAAAPLWTAALTGWGLWRVGGVLYAHRGWWRVRLRLGLRQVRQQIQPLQSRAVIGLVLLHLAGTGLVAVLVLEDRAPWDFALGLAPYLLLTLVVPLYVLWRLPAVRAAWELAPSKLLASLALALLLFLSKGSGSDLIARMFGTSSVHFPMSTLAASTLAGVSFATVPLMLATLAIEILALLLVFQHSGAPSSGRGWRAVWRALGTAAPGLALLAYVGLAAGVVQAFAGVQHRPVAKLWLAQVAWELDAVPPSLCQPFQPLPPRADPRRYRVVPLSGAPDKALLLKEGQEVRARPFKAWTDDDFLRERPRVVGIVACHGDELRPPAATFDRE